MGKVCTVKVVGNLMGVEGQVGETGGGSVC